MQPVLLALSTTHKLLSSLSSEYHIAFVLTHGYKWVLPSLRRYVRTALLFWHPGMTSAEHLMDLTVDRQETKCWKCMESAFS